MPYTLLRTKVAAPTVRPNLVRRPRLVRRLNQSLSLNCGLTLISAPAGYGKSTLVSEWVDRLRSDTVPPDETPQRIAWLSLDERDNELGRFLFYVVSALNRAGGLEPDLGAGALAMLQSPRPPPVQDVLTSLINGLVDASGKTILVLDDYHLIDCAPVDGTTTVDGAVTFLLDHLPSQLHVVLVTRVDPNLPIARYRARGQLTELRAADLRFNVAETTRFLNDVMGLDLSEEDVAALTSRTEGWIAGLQLAALSMKGGKDVGEFVRSFAGSHHFVLDYLVEEVFEQQTPEVRSFLLRTAILDRLTGSLCDAVTGQQNGQVTLQALEHGNLFVVALDEQRHWYRYHHLFSDLLRHRLRQKHGGERRTLHGRASDWYEQHGMPDEAVEHALKGEQYARAADLIAEYVDHALQYGERALLERWLNLMPADVALSNPHLAILFALNRYVRGQMDETERYLEAAERALDTQGPQSPWATGSTELDAAPGVDLMKLKGRAATVRSYLVSYRGDVPGSIYYARQALDCLPHSDAIWRWSAYDSLGTTYSGIDEPLAHDMRLKALQASQSAGNAYIVLLASLRLVVTLRDRGRLREAIERCQQNLKLAHENGLAETALAGWLHGLWAEVLAEKNELSQALELATKGVRLTEPGKDVTLRGSSALCLIRVLFSRGEMEEALAIIHKATELTGGQHLSPWITVQMAAWRARILLAQENVEAASRWADARLPQAEEELTSFHDFDYAVLARVLVAQGKADEANRLLQRLLPAAEGGGRTSKVIELRALQALALQAGRDSEQAMAKLEQALALAEPRGFVRIFLDEGPPMARLLQKGADAGLADGYLSRLLAASAADRRQHSATARVADQSQLVEPLSDREIEVLHHVAQGLTNRQIGDRLYLSLNTVKVHTRNIYGKLGVHSRTQAVALAQDLGILTDS